MSKFKKYIAGLVLLVTGGTAVALYGTTEQMQETKTTTPTSETATVTQANSQSENNPSQPTLEDTTTEPSAQPENNSSYSFSVGDIPEYSGTPYVELNGNQPAFDDALLQTTEPIEEYSELDDLGRCGVAFANVCRDLMPTEERGPIGHIRPSGWKTVKYNHLIDGNYLYNRCHLIGYQLAAENANERNLITGTRYLNVTGMLPFENEVGDYVRQTGNHVLYRVTPIFEGDNLVASGVQMEAWSVEDGGAGVCFHVYCYNVQPHIVIDYKTGESQLNDDAESQANQQHANSQKQSNEKKTTNDTEAADYVLNKNTKKYHTPNCSSVSDIAPHNKAEQHCTAEELEKMGYSPCQRCLKTN